MKTIYYSLALAVMVAFSSCKTMKNEPTLQYYFLTEVDSTDGGIRLQGNVSELATGEPVLFGGIGLYDGLRLIKITETDFDGNYSFQLPDSLATASLEWECTYLGLKPVRIKDLNLRPATTVQLDVQMESTGKLLPYGPFCPSYKVPLLEQDNTTSGQTFTSEQIRRSGVRSN